MPRVLLALALTASVYPLAILFVGGEGTVGGAAIVGIVTGGVSLLAGVPLAFWFIKRHWLRLWQSVFAGFVLGAVVGAVFNTFVEPSEIAIFVLKFAAIGCAHTTLFWFTAFWRNQRLAGTRAPERSAANAENAA